MLALLGQVLKIRPPQRARTGSLARSDRRSAYGDDAWDALPSLSLTATIDRVDHCGRVVGLIRTLLVAEHYRISLW
jgi:hypothetical protein